jgi:hypothetical protein
VFCNPHLWYNWRAKLQIFNLLTDAAQHLWLDGLGAAATSGLLATEAAVMISRSA